VPDPYLTDLKEYERVVEQIASLKADLSALERDRDRLRKKLRAHNELARGVPAAQLGVVLSTDESTPDAVRDIVSLLSKLGGTAQLSDVATKLGISERAAAGRLARAVDANLVERVARGRYRLLATKSSEPSTDGLSEYAGNESAGETGEAPT